MLAPSNLALSECHPTTHMLRYLGPHRAMQLHRLRQASVLQ